MSAVVVERDIAVIVSELPLPSKVTINTVVKLSTEPKFVVEAEVSVADAWK